jgi:tetratricopeptide (TPR) repeat protein
MITTAIVGIVTSLATLQAAAQTRIPDQARREAFQHYQRGMELLAAEQFEKAADAFRSAVGLDDLFTDAHYGLGRSYMGLQRYTSAVQAYEACLKAAEQLHGLRNSDRVAHDRRIDDEIRAMREAEANIRRQTTGGVQPQILQLEARRRELERSRSSLSDTFEPPAEVLLALGSAHFRNGDLPLAQGRWEEAVKVNSRLGEAWNNLAVAYMRGGRKADAERAVKNAESAGFRVNPRLKDDIRAMKE